jgi:hypothetical protein
MLLSGIVAVIVALMLAIWSITFVQRRRGGLELILLSVLLLLWVAVWGHLLLD